MHANTTLYLELHRCMMYAVSADYLTLVCPEADLLFMPAELYTKYPLCVYLLLTQWHGACIVRWGPGMVGRAGAGSTHSKFLGRAVLCYPASYVI